MTPPRAIDSKALRRDIFAHLSAAMAQHGPRVLVHDGPLFSRAPDCPGVVALLDRADVRQVLGDPTRFQLPRSGALAVDLPADLVSLNRSLHSLGVVAHRVQRMPLVQAIPAIDAEDIALVERIVACHPLPRQFPLMSTMRALTSEVAARLIFGDDPAAVRLGTTLSGYFVQRRSATALDRARAGDQAAVIAAGRAAAAGLLARVTDATAGGPTLVDRLAGTGMFDSSELIGHLNILYISSSEPLAAVLGWTLLILTQLPDLAAGLADAAASPAAFAAAVEPILLESMRMLPPNALMTRVVDTPLVLSDCRLEAQTEILMAPLLMHRDPAIFTDPARFDPGRWHDLLPPPFSFLPFGGGTHACIGRTFAMSLLTTLLRAFFRGGLRPALNRGAVIDWRMAIVFQPSDDIVLQNAGSDFPTWRGPISRLVDIKNCN